MNNELLRHQLVLQAQNLKSENERTILSSKVKDAQRTRDVQVSQLEAARAQR